MTQGIIGNENSRVFTFGKRNRVQVTFTRIDGLWHAHAALLPRPVRSIQSARDCVRNRLAMLGKNHGGA